MIKLKKYETITKREVEIIEQKIGFKLPQDYKEFIVSYNGAEPEDNILLIDKKISVEFFLLISQSVEKLCNIDGFPTYAFPFASAYSGDYIYFQRNNFKIYYWSHELNEECKKLADNFSEFLALLIPCDMSSINIDPKQIISVTTNPEYKDFKFEF